MAHFCSICDEEPTSHSFIHLSQDDGVHIFYSCPALAKKYTDTAGILAHFDNTLSGFQCHQEPWRWIFDAYDFGWKHLLEFNTAIGMAKIITEKYGNTVQSIHIVNANWYIRIGLNIVLPFLSETVQKKIKMIE